MVNHHFPSKESPEVQHGSQPRALLLPLGHLGNLATVWGKSGIIFSDLCQFIIWGTRMVYPTFWSRFQIGFCNLLYLASHSQQVIGISHISSQLGWLFLTRHLQNVLIGSRNSHTNANLSLVPTGTNHWFSRGPLVEHQPKLARSKLQHKLF